MSKDEKDELVISLYNDSKTISIMNEFEGIQGDFTYKRLVVRNGMSCAKSICGKVRFSLVIERGSYSDYAGQCTMTELKKYFNNYQLVNHIKREIRIEKREEYKDTDRFFRFKVPFLLKAQNSMNRIGYGWYWCGNTYKKGTYYGETTEYYIVGVYVNSYETSNNGDYNAKERKPFLDTNYITHISTGEETGFELSSVYCEKISSVKENADLNKISDNNVISVLLISYSDGDFKSGYIICDEKDNIVTYKYNFLNNDEIEKWIYKNGYDWQQIRVNNCLAYYSGANMKLFSIFTECLLEKMNVLNALLFSMYYSCIIDNPGTKKFIDALNSAEKVWDNITLLKDRLKAITGIYDKYYMAVMISAIIEIPQMMIVGIHYPKLGVLYNSSLSDVLKDHANCTSLTAERVIFFWAQYIGTITYENVIWYFENKYFMENER